MSHDTDDLSTYKDTHIDDWNDPQKLLKFGSNIHATMLNEFDVNPGTDFIQKGGDYGTRGAFLGLTWGLFRAGMIDPPAGVALGKHFITNSIKELNMGLQFITIGITLPV